MATITLSELLHGVHRTDSEERRAKKQSFVDRQVSSFQIQDFGAEEAAQHAKILAFLQVRGIAIGPYDSLIAATALAHDWSVATLNISEFQRVPELKVIDASPWMVK